MTPRLIAKPDAETAQSQLWRCSGEEAARTAWEEWRRRAEDSGIKPSSPSPEG